MLGKSPKPSYRKTAKRCEKAYKVTEIAPESFIIFILVKHVVYQIDNIIYCLYLIDHSEIRLEKRKSIYK